MDFQIPTDIQRDVEQFQRFLKDDLQSDLAAWYRAGAIPKSFLATMGKGGWFSIEWEQDHLKQTSALREALIQEELAKLSPGAAVTLLAHVNLGFIALFLYGSAHAKQLYGRAAAEGEMVMCVGNSENQAGSDAAGIGMSAEKVEGGWRLNGTKSYVTNGAIADLGVITAVSDPDAPRNQRISMYLVDLNDPGVSRKKLNKQVWIPSDLTRIALNDVFVPDDHLMGEHGRGLQQVLTVFTHSRVPISAMTVGTAAGAFELALDRASKRDIFGRKIIDFQAKAFEFAEYYAHLEAARLMLWKACVEQDQGRDFRQHSSLAKYLSVDIARKVTAWAADIFGAVSVMYEHPIHKFPLDAWASSLGEGTQDVQKLVIFRELLKSRQ